MRSDLCVCYIQICVYMLLRFVCICYSDLCAIVRFVCICYLDLCVCYSVKEKKRIYNPNIDEKKTKAMDNSFKEGGSCGQKLCVHILATCEGDIN